MKEIKPHSSPPFTIDNYRYLLYALDAIERPWDRSVEFRVGKSSSFIKGQETPTVCMVLPTSRFPGGIKNAPKDTPVTHLYPQTDIIIASALADRLIFSHWKVTQEDRGVEKLELHFYYDPRLAGCWKGPLRFLADLTFMVRKNNT